MASFLFVHRFIATILRAVASIRYQSSWLRLVKRRRTISRAKKPPKNTTFLEASDWQFLINPFHGGLQKVDG